MDVNDDDVNEIDNGDFKIIFIDNLNDDDVDGDISADDEQEEMVYGGSSMFGDPDEHHEYIYDNKDIVYGEDDVVFGDPDQHQSAYDDMNIFDFRQIGLSESVSIIDLRLLCGAILIFTLVSMYCYHQRTKFRYEEIQ